MLHFAAAGIKQQDAMVGEGEGGKGGGWWWWWYGSYDELVVSSIEFSIKMKIKFRVHEIWEILEGKAN